MRRLLILPMLLILCTSCVLLEEKTLTLWTNRPEFTDYIEVYNTEQEEYRIEIIYKESPAYAIIHENEHPDIVAGEFLKSTNVINSFSDLEPMFEEGMITRSDIYPSLLQLGKRGEELLLLPVSFRLPILFFNKNRLGEDLAAFTLSLEDIKQITAEFNEESKPRRPVMGFSPRWSAEFMYICTLLLGTGFGENSNGQLIWNNQKLLDSINFFRTWSEEINGGRELEDYFKGKYFYDPDFKLLLNERIILSYRDLRSFFSIPKEKRENLDFRYIGEEDKIPVLEDMVFMGIPKKSSNKKAAQTFLAWFYQIENQKKCLATSHFKRTRTFGIADGFSSLSEINEKELPGYYSELGGRIPRKENLLFPEPLPSNWKRIKEEVLEPYLLKEAGRDQEIGGFETELQRWILQQSE